jgi:hypothetical protein
MQRKSTLRYFLLFNVAILLFASTQTWAKAGRSF